VGLFIQWHSHQWMNWDDRARHLGSHPNCTIAKNVIVTSLGWSWYLDRTITDSDGMNDYSLANAFISDFLVQINHVCYSDMSRNGATHADKTRKGNPVKRMILVWALFCSNVISKASVVRPKSGCLDMRNSIWHRAHSFVGGQLPYHLSRTTGPDKLKLLAQTLQTTKNKLNIQNSKVLHPGPSSCQWESQKLFQTR